MAILNGIDGIAIVNLTAEDVVRHRLVKEIIKAYDIIETEERIRRERKKAAQNPDNEPLEEAKPEAGEQK